MSKSKKQTTGGTPGAQTPRRGTRPGGKISTVVKLNSLTVGPHADSISFLAMSIDPNSHALLTKLVRTSAEILLAFDLPKHDRDWRIEQKCGLKGYNIKKTGDAPILINLVFTVNQIGRLVNAIRAESEVVMEIIELQGQLFEPPAGDKSDAADGALIATESDKARRKGRRSIAAEVEATEGKDGNGHTSQE